MAQGNKKKVSNLLTAERVADMLAQGKGRNEIIRILQDEGMDYHAAKTMVYEGVRSMLPSPEFWEDYKRAKMEENMDRLDTIIDSTISGDTAEKNTAIRAIETQVKICGGGNSVNIAKTSKGDEVIQITFGK